MTSGLMLRGDDSILSRMITTIDDDTNGFRHELIPIALSSSEASSKGLLEATLALSSFHLGKQEEALMHKVKAINSLSKSFNGQNASRIAQFSACMMLCVYSVGTAPFISHTGSDQASGLRRIRYDMERPPPRRKDPIAVFLTTGTQHAGFSFPRLLAGVP
jgi:hypothetical protein